MGKQHSPWLVPVVLDAPPSLLTIYKHQLQPANNHQTGLQTTNTQLANIVPFSVNCKKKLNVVYLADSVRLNNIG